MSRRKRIIIKNVHPAVKTSFKNLSENLGHPTLNKLNLELIHEICEKYDSPAQNIEIKIPDMIIEQKPDIIEVMNIPKQLHKRLQDLAEKLGFKNISELVRFEMHIKCSVQPGYMLKKNKGFKEIED